MKSYFCNPIGVIVIALCSFNASGAAQAQEKSAKPPNVLFIICDQLSPRAMGGTGQTPAKTPNLDRLATNGVTFTNAYCASPVCAPTRHSIYTGLYPSDHGVLMNDHPMKPGVRTLMDYLNHAGWTTANIGKMHNAPYHCRRDFQYVLHHEFYVDDAGISHYAPFLRSEIERQGLTYRPWSTPRPGLNWLSDVRTVAFANWMPEDITAEHWITDECLKFIGDQIAHRPKQPFFLHASYFPPHHPYGPIAKYANMYNPADIRLPPNFDRSELDRWCGGMYMPAHMTDDDVKRWIAYYLGFVTQLDAEIGRLLDGLEHLGVSDNTIVIFTSDHGDMLAEHGMFYKGVMYEASARVPFIVRWPGARRGVRESVPISHVDIMPTILSIAGVKAETRLRGEDLRPAVDGHGRQDRPIYAEFFGEGPPQLPFGCLMYRQGAYKLIASHKDRRNKQAHYELYNVDEDPWEMRNLAGEFAMASTFHSLRDSLTAIFSEQKTKLPDKMPPVVPRSAYRIPWPADPWKPVEPIDASPVKATPTGSAAPSRPSATAK